MTSIGDRILTKREAAEVLGVHLATVFRLIARGELHPIEDGRFAGLPEEAVFALRDARLAGDRRILDRQALSSFCSSLREMRQELDELLGGLGIPGRPLRSSDLELVCLYRTAAEYAERGWSPYDEEVWAEHFSRLHPADLQRLEKATLDPHPWRPFLRLANTMRHEPYRDEMREVLGVARDNLARTALTWCEMRGVAFRRFTCLVRKDARPNQRLLTRLAKARQRRA